MKYLMRGLGIVLAVEVVLLASGLVPAHIAAALIVLTESTAFVLGASIVFKLVKSLRARLSQGERIYTALEKCLEGSLPPQLIFMAKHEIGVFASIARLIVRKKEMPAGAREIKYGGSLRVLMAVLVFASVIEIVAVELLVPWDVPRLVILILSLYSLVWIVGLLAATIVYPHYLHAGKLVLRFFHYHTVVVPLCAGASMTSGEKSASANKTITKEQGCYSLNVLGSTNAFLSLGAESAIVQDGKPVGGVRKVFFSVDDQRSAVEAVRQALDALQGDEKDGPPAGAAEAAPGSADVGQGGLPRRP